jgi:hypothetical protein
MESWRDCGFLLYDLDTDVCRIFLWHSDLVGLNTGERRKSNVCISIISLCCYQIHVAPGSMPWTVWYEMNRSRWAGEFDLDGFTSFSEASFRTMRTRTSRYCVWLHEL